MAGRDAYQPNRNLMPRYSPISPTQRENYFRLRFALKKSQCEVDGLNPTLIAQAIRNSMPIENVAAVMNVLGEVTYEFNENNHD